MKLKNLLLIIIILFGINFSYSQTTRWTYPKPRTIIMKSMTDSVRFNEKKIEEIKEYSDSAFSIKKDIYILLYDNKIIDVASFLNMFCIPRNYFIEIDYFFLGEYPGAFAGIIKGKEYIIIGNKIFGVDVKLPSGKHLKSKSIIYEYKF